MKLDDIRYQLIELGLTDYESKGYLSMLFKQNFTATELSRISGIPRTRVYDVLQRLVQKGICVDILGKVKKYKAVAPETAMNRLLEYQKADFIIKENLANSISSILQKQYQKNSTNHNHLDYIELLRDPKQVAQKFIQLVGNAQHEVLVFVKPPFSGSRDKLEKQTSSEIEALKKNITCKSLYEISKNKKEREWQFKQIDMAARYGEHARIIDDLPLKMSVFDESKVLFAMEDYHPTKNLQTSLVIEHRSLAKSLKILFETLWFKGQDYHNILKID